MLNTDTKRRIDTARDILVGKVPDPKSQVEQITIAMIYKFMDDMDAEAEELGGSRKFFAGDFARYGWAKLMHSGLGGFETLNLYAEAIMRMPENPGIPPLFRDIFKNAYLPYRDPETLRAFLKIIDEFEYDHSERLGDAFEYLLSVLGSQGDAGQFRTPRHIIDFMVAIIDPKKHESVLDPACGTAGFLISSYKHILKANTDAYGHSTLTPDDKGRLAANFKGYDISPDMVRLSLVNMYLHGFTDPHIFEYDTLTSQDRWNEYADVILANPPFMSPKGGIKPHNRFSVQSKRSEVLFVDYMSEHLTPGGRAAIIVPEGIIFQSQKAYTKLRKLLVEDYLVAVVSLPQGVFNPYSGVKTSILILDKPRAKRSSQILFVRIDDDGYDLGATRKRTGAGDLPEAERLLRDWFEAIDTSDSHADFESGTARALLVSRDEIAASGDYRLTADTYRRIDNNTGSRFPWVPLGDLLGRRVSNRIGDDLTLPILSITMKHGLVDQSNKFKKRIASADISGYKKVARNELVVGFPIDEGVLGIQTLYPFAAVSPAYDVWTVNVDRVDLSYFELVLRSQEARSRYRLKMRGTAGRRRVLDKAEFLSIEFPLPPLEVQEEIVAEVEGYRKVIDGARAVLENYRPHIPIHPDWPEMELGEICRFIDYRGKTPEKTTSGIPLITAKNVRDGFIDPEPREFIAEADYDSWMTRGIPQVGDVLFTTEAPLGNAAEITSIDRFALAQRLIALSPNREFLNGGFLKNVLVSKRMRERIFALQSGTTVYGIKASLLKGIKIPVPLLATQQVIVAEIEAEQALVSANRELIDRFEKKIQATLARVWAEDQPAPAEP